LASSLPNRNLQGDSNKTLPKSNGGRTQTSQGGEVSTQAPEVTPACPGDRVSMTVRHEEQERGRGERESS
jgi:hypothetical protein